MMSVRKSMGSIVYAWFGERLTPTQLSLLNDIIFEEHRRIAVRAMTRYGKSWTASLASLLYAVMNNNSKCAIVAPTYEQARILMNHIADWISKSHEVEALADIDDYKFERLKREVNKKRVTFKNGSEIRILSAQGRGERILGHGADLIIEDEASWISDRAHHMILRMLGDSHNGGILVEMGNPFGRNHFWRDWEDRGFKKYHITWKTAVAEGRVTKGFIDEMRKRMGEAEFRILYEAEFAEESGRFYPLSLISKCSIAKASGNPVDDYDFFMGIDVARYGTDETAYMIVGTKDYEKFRVFSYETTSKKPLTDVAGRAVSLHRKWNFKKIIVDETGIGGGVVDILRERGIPVRGVVFSQKERSELYTNLKNMMESGKIEIPNDDKLISQLNSYSYEFSESGRLKIIKDEASHDDVSDALALAVYGLRGRKLAVYSWSW